MTLRPGSPEFLSALDRWIVRDADRFYRDEDDEDDCCPRPGRGGCGVCECCEQWAESMIDREREDDPGTDVW